MEYQRWAAKVHRDKPLNENDPSVKEMMEKGKSLACGMCNLALRTIMDRYKAGKEGKLKTGFKESDVKLILKTVCEHIAPGMAREMKLQEEDAIMNCKRVVNEHSQGMIDGISVGEDIDAFCKDEAQLCELGHEQMMYTTYKMAEARQADHKRQQAEQLKDEA